MEEKQKHSNAKTCGNLDVSKILLVSSNLLVIFPWTYWKERWSTNLRSPDPRPPGRGPELPRIAGMLATAAAAVGVLASVPSRAPSWQWKTGARFKDRIFPTLFWDTPTQSEPLEADASWWTKSAWDQDPVCNLWHVVDMRSGINLFDLSSCFGNTLHCITSEKSVKAFAGCKWILELAWAFHELVHCTHAYNCKELM